MDIYNALKIDKKYIYIKCNTCYKLNNRFLDKNYKIKHIYDKRIKNCYHIYNSYGNYEDREENFKSNCLYNNNSYITIKINKKTLKIYN